MTADWDWVSVIWRTRAREMCANTDELPASTLLGN